MNNMTPLSRTTVMPVPVPTWALALAVVATFALYLLTHENGVLLTAAHAELLHELTHDARHALGVPCH
ncbi:MAG: CbtB-domain containing protein [Actinomycetes bacterium]